MNPDSREKADEGTDSDINGSTFATLLRYHNKKNSVKKKSKGNYLKIDNHYSPRPHLTLTSILY